MSAALPSPRSLLTTREVCTQLRISRGTLDKLAADVSPPRVRIGRQWRWYADGLYDWLERVEEWRASKDETAHGGSDGGTHPGQNPGNRSGDTTRGRKRSASTGQRDVPKLRGSTTTPRRESPSQRALKRRRLQTASQTTSKR